MLKAILFDMDGVIIDSEPLHFEADEKLMADLGYPVPAHYFNAFIGISNPDMWKTVKAEFHMKESIDTLLALQKTINTDLLEAADLEPIAGIRPLLSSLKKNQIKAGIGSSSSNECIHQVVGKFDLFSYFDVLQSGEEVAKGKPEPDVYLEVARKLQVEPHECVVIEDAHAGVTAAKKAGMFCIGFQNPNSGNQDLSKADWIVKSIEEVTLEGIRERWPIRFEKG